MASLFQRYARYREKSEALWLLKQGFAQGRRYGARLKPEARTEVNEALLGLQEALKSKDRARVVASSQRLAQSMKQHFAPYQWREMARSFASLIAIVLAVKIFVAQIFEIPSGSMLPTLQIGDRVVVNMFEYGLKIPFTFIKIFDFRAPKRGDVVVFTEVPPCRAGTFTRSCLSARDMIKRVIAVGGDEVEVRAGRIYLNGNPIPHEPLSESCQEWEKDDAQSAAWSPYGCVASEERLGTHRYRTIESNEEASHLPDFPPMRIEPGHIFVMGDNRDRSHDSRFWGQVPLNHVKGRALFIFWSYGQPGFTRARILKGID